MQIKNVPHRAKAQSKRGVFISALTEYHFEGYAITVRGIVAISIVWRKDDSSLRLRFVENQTHYSSHVKQIEKYRLVPTMRPGVLDVKILHFVEAWLDTITELNT